MTIYSNSHPVYTQTLPFLDNLNIFYVPITVTMAQNSSNSITVELKVGANTISATASISEGPSLYNDEVV